MQDYSNSSALATKLLQSCTKPSSYCFQMQFNDSFGPHINATGFGGSRSVLSLYFDQCWATSGARYDVNMGRCVNMALWPNINMPLSNKDTAFLQTHTVEFYFALCVESSENIWLWSLNMSLFFCINPVSVIYKMTKYNKKWHLSINVKYRTNYIIWFEKIIRTCLIYCSTSNIGQPIWPYSYDYSDIRLLYGPFPVAVGLSLECETKLISFTGCVSG